MASAEKLLNEAQYAFANISFDKSLSNTRNASRAKTLSRKIIRRFPGSTEAFVAHAILRRLGEEAYTSNLSVRHVHRSKGDHSGHAKPQHQPRRPRPERESMITSMEEVAELDWGGVLRWLTSRSLSILVIVVFTLLILVSAFGPLLLLPVIALLAFTGPFRSLLNLQQREVLDKLIQRINTHVRAGMIDT